MMWKCSDHGSSCTLAHRRSRVSVFVCVHQSSWQDELDHGKWFLLRTALHHRLLVGVRAKCMQICQQILDSSQSENKNHWLTFLSFWAVSVYPCAPEFLSVALPHSQALRLVLQAHRIECVRLISSPGKLWLLHFLFCFLNTDRASSIVLLLHLLILFLNLSLSFPADSSKAFFISSKSLAIFLFKDLRQFVQ